MNYFVHDKRDLSPAYVKSCEKFLDSICWPSYYGGSNTGGKIFKVKKLQASSSKRHASSNKLDRAWALGYNGSMKLSDFLDKHHSRADKMRILKKMLKAAEANKSKTVSVKKARSIIFNHKEGDMKI